MNDRPRPKPVDVIPDAMSARVLTRASELDALRRAGATVAELREAATEAGISAEAFDAALAEVQSAEATPVVVRGSRTRLKAIAAAVALVIGLGLAFVTTRLVVPASAPGTVEQTLEYRCLTPAQISELVRRVVNPQTTTITFSDASPAVFTIRATPAEIDKVESVLAEQEKTCARP